MQPAKRISPVLVREVALPEVAAHQPTSRGRASRGRPRVAAVSREPGKERPEVVPSPAPIRLTRQTPHRSAIILIAVLPARTMPLVASARSGSTSIWQPTGGVRSRSLMARARASSQGVVRAKAAKTRINGKGKGKERSPSPAGRTSSGFKYCYKFLKM